MSQERNRSGPLASETASASESTAATVGGLGHGQRGAQSTNLASMVKPPRIFDNKKESNFKQWADRMETYFALVGMPIESRTAILMLNLSSEICHTARCLGVTSGMQYEEAAKRLAAHFSPVETVEEARAQFQVRTQEQGEAVESFARDLRVLAAEAFPNAEEAMLQTLMVT